MLDRMQLKHVMLAWLASMWSASALAASATFVTGLSSLDPAAVGIAMILSMIGGGAATLRKLARPDIPIQHMGLEIASDMAASLFAGLIAYFTCAWREYPALLQAIVISIAGYGGSRVIERILNGGLAKIDAAMGVKPPESTP